MNYHNKYFLITGAYRGIGRSIAIYFGEKGANLVLTYHHHQKETQELEELLKEKYHIEVYSIYLDLQDEKSIQSLYEFINDQKIEIDFLINNSAITYDSDYLDKTKKEFMNVLEINVVGTFLMMQYFDRFFHDKNIINISSTDGIDTGSIYSVDYNVSKAGVNMLGKTLAMTSPNRIITLCPNWVKTEAIIEMNEDYLKDEMQRIGQKELISPNTIPKVIDEALKNNVKTGTVIRIEGDYDVREN